MSRSILQIVFGASLFAMSSCSCVERGSHAERKMWVDYNSLRFPAMYFEQIDHLPYRPAKVGYFRWQYNKDPGHQLAALGHVTPPNCKACDDQGVPKGDEPFAYQVLYPSAVPGQTEQLWGTKLPEPINVSHGGVSDMPPNGPGALPPVTPSPSGNPQGGTSIPILPPSPPSVNDSQFFAPPRPAAPSGPEKLPSFELPPPPSKPIDENVPPLQGPGSPDNPNVHLTTGQAIRSNPTPSDRAYEWAH